MIKIKKSFPSKKSTNSNTRYFNSTRKSIVRFFLDGTSTFKYNSTLSTVLKKFGRNRFEIFTMRNNTCYFLNCRNILDKKKINQSMKVVSLLQPIEFLKTTDKLEKAIQIMLDCKTNSVPVVKNKQIIGEVRILPIIKRMARDNIPSIKIKHLEHRRVWVSSNKPLSSARRLLKDNRLDFLPVKDGQRISRVITSRDLVSILIPPERVGKLGTIGKSKIKSLGQKISNLGTNAFPHANKDELLGNIIKSMVESKQRYCILEHSTENQSFVTGHDIIRLCYKNGEKRIPLYQIDKENLNIVGSHSSRIQIVLKKFSRSVEKIIEARVSVKRQKREGLDSEYHQNLLIITPTKRHSFSTKSWSIEEGISNFIEMISKKISEKKSRHNSRKSIRKISKEEILSL